MITIHLPQNYYEKRINKKTKNKSRKKRLKTLTKLDIIDNTHIENDNDTTQIEEGSSPIIYSEEARKFNNDKIVKIKRVYIEKEIPYFQIELVPTQKEDNINDPSIDLINVQIQRERAGFQSVKLIRAKDLLNM